MNSVAPIALFVYNRPDHTLQTLQALAKNDMAAESVLYIFSDGAKAGDALSTAKVSETRQLIRSQQWCKEVNIIEAENNKGLASSIISGVTEIVNKHGKVIVVEDDLVTAKGFLRFMNDSLNLYEREEKVMHISGYIFPVKERLPTTFFYRQASCWGWATWRNRWNKLQKSPAILYDELRKTGKIKIADIDGTSQFINQLKLNIEGSIKTWGVLWHFTVFLNDGLCLHPGKSLVKNIGMDSSGSNCGPTDAFEVKLTDFVPVKRIEIKDNKKIYTYLKRFYKVDKKIDFLSMAKKTTKRILTPTGWHKIKMLKDKRYKDFYNEEQRIKTLPRYTETETTFLDRKIRITDNASFLFIKNELFDSQIYYFKADTPQPYIIDAGANIGLSVIYFKQLYPDAEIVAFEPDDKAFDALTQNIKSFGLNNVRLIKKGLWKEETTLRFHEEGADGGRIATENDVEKITSIETIRLRDFLQRQVDFLKIDIEGAETIVLNDCIDLLPNVKRLFVEYHSFSQLNQNLDELLGILSKSGFRYIIHHVGVFSQHPFVQVKSHGGIDLQLNIFAYRI